MVNEKKAISVQLLPWKFNFAPKKQVSEKWKLIIHLQVVRWSICAKKVIEELEDMFVSRWFNFEN